MAKGPRREVLAGLRGLRWSVPAKRIRCAGGRALSLGEEFQRLWLHQRASATQHAFGENRYIHGCGKAPGMSGNAAHDPGILIMDFTLRQTAAKAAVIHRGWNERFPF